MEFSTHVLLTYGYLLLFAWVLVEQLGIPLPATPILLAAGALSAEGHFSFSLALLAAVIGAVCADTTWFLVGRRYGHHVLRILCKLSLEPTTCVRRSQDSFTRRRGVLLLFAKFIPGLGLLAPPVAGQNGMSLAPFLVFDAMGGSLWITTLLVLGRLFGDVLKHSPGLLHWVARFSSLLLLLAIAGFFLARLYRRRAVLSKLAAARLEPEELKRLLDAGEPVYIVDLRHPLELLPDPFTLPGALHLSPDALAARHEEIPRDRDVVLYCTCPSEATSAKVAMTLHRLGIERVRPLRGGFDAWKKLGFPLDPIPDVAPALTTIQPAP